MVNLVVEWRLEDWAAWGEGLATKEAWRDWAATARALPTPAQAPVSVMPALLRRRLGHADRQGIEAAWELGAGHGRLPVAWASRHGQIIRSARLLQSLACGEAPAPMDFSLSVHNAPLGILSIASDGQRAVTAIAAGDESLVAALLEAQGWMAEGAEQALVIHTDEPPPPDYVGVWDGDCADVGLALRLGSAGQPMRLSLSQEFGPQSSEPLPVLLLRFLASDAVNGEWRRGERTWRWSKLALA